MISSVCDLKIELAGVCEAAARAGAPCIGSGKKDEGGGLAVDAMRARIVAMKCRCVAQL